VTAISRCRAGHGVLNLRFKELTEAYSVDMSAPYFQSDAVDEDNF